MDTSERMKPPFMDFIEMVRRFERKRIEDKLVNVFPFFIQFFFQFSVFQILSVVVRFHDDINY
jgi:hypothetical protein